MSTEARGWPIRRWLTLFAVAEAVLLLAALVGGAVALGNLTDGPQHASSTSSRRSGWPRRSCRPRC